MIILDEHHVLSVLREFVTYYNHDRPHRTLGLQTPELRPRPTAGPIRSRPMLIRLHQAEDVGAAELQTAERLRHWHRPFIVHVVYHHASHICLKGGNRAVVKVDEPGHTHAMPDVPAALILQPPS